MELGLTIVAPTIGRQVDVVVSAAEGTPLGDVATEVTAAVGCASAVALYAEDGRLDPAAPSAAASSTRRADLRRGAGFGPGRAWLAGAPRRVGTRRGRRLPARTGGPAGGSRAGVRPPARRCGRVPAARPAAHRGGGCDGRGPGVDQRDNGRRQARAPGGPGATAAERTPPPRRIDAHPRRTRRTACAGDRPRTGAGPSTGRRGCARRIRPCASSCPKSRSGPHAPPSL